MKEEEYQKLFKLSKKYLISFIITLFLSIIFLYIANISATKEKPIPTDYHYLIGNNKEEEGDYIKVTASTIPYLFASEDDEYNYYIIFDENNYMYIARLTDKTYKLLKNKYDAQEEISYEIKGYIYNTKEDLKELAIDAYNKNTETNTINKDNFSSYFGNTYVDETITPSTTMEAILTTLGILSIIFNIIIIIYAIVALVNNKKTIKKYGKETLEYELAKSTTKAYKKANIYLTDKYIISTLYGLKVYSYEDFIWIYNQKRSYNFISIGIYLLGLTNKKRTHQLAYRYHDEQELINIMSEISSKSDKIMTGYTKENIQKFKELTKKKK